MPAQEDLRQESDQWSDVKGLTAEQHSAVLDYRVRILERFVEKMAPVWEEMRASLRTIVEQNAASLKAHSDFEARLRTLERQETTTTAFGKFFGPIAAAVISALLSSAVTYVAIHYYTQPQIEIRRDPPK